MLPYFIEFITSYAVVIRVELYRQVLVVVDIDRVRPM